MRLQTKRFILRSFEEKDCALVTHYLSDWKIAGPLVTPPYPFYYEHAVGFYKEMRAAEAAGRQEAFVIAASQTDEVMGVVGVHPVPSKTTGEFLCKLGYWLGGCYWGKGVLQETLPIVLDKAFTDLGYNRMVAYTNTDNDRSQKVLRSMGFDYLGVEDSPKEEARGTPQQTSWELTPEIFAARKKE